MGLLEQVMKKLGHDNKRKFIFSITLDAIILIMFTWMILSVSGCSCYQGLTFNELGQMGCDLSHPLASRVNNPILINNTNFSPNINFSFTT